MGKEAFWGCRRLEKVELPNSLEKLGNYCFFKTGLKRITIPGGVKRITHMCFGDCGLLNEVGLEDGIECIGANLLTSVNGLNKKSALPATVYCLFFPVSCVNRPVLCANHWPQNAGAVL
ncbi:MAG: leucine-rich repeat domain-containing protein [Faecalibacterium sp.]|nr:leucine-rich repeat domain-containing protein [Faecalibacterium sp.]